MVPGDPQEGAALSAPDTTVEGNPEAEAEVAESTEAAVGSSAGLSWADISEVAPAPTIDFAQAGGVAFGALGDEIADDFDILRFDARSLLDPIKPKEIEVTAEDLFEALDAGPAGETVVQPTASNPIETDNNLESESRDNQIPKEETDFTENLDFQEAVAEVADSVVEPIVGRSPTLEGASDLNTFFCSGLRPIPTEGLPQAPQPLVTCRLVTCQLHHQDHPASVALRVAGRSKQNV